MALAGAWTLGYGASTGSADASPNTPASIDETSVIEAVQSSQRMGPKLLEPPPIDQLGLDIRAFIATINVARDRVTSLAERYGADVIEEAMHRIALMSSRSDSFNRLSYRLFKSRRLSRFLYPVLRAIRNGTLKVLGRRKMGY